MLEQHVTHTNCDFDQSLDQLERRIDWVPKGWQPLYLQLRRRLIAVRSIKRAHIVLDGPWPDLEVLHIESRNADRVIRGILRKTARASRYRCCECGDAGKPRDIGQRELVLCSPCAGLRQLEVDLERLQRFIRSRQARTITGWVPYAEPSPHLVAFLHATKPEAIVQDPDSEVQLNVPAIKALVQQSLQVLQNQAVGQG